MISAACLSISLCLITLVASSCLLLGSLENRAWIFSGILFVLLVGDLLALYGSFVLRRSWTIPATVLAIFIAILSGAIGAALLCSVEDVTGVDEAINAVPYAHTVIEAVRIYTSDLIGDDSWRHFARTAYIQLVVSEVYAVKAVALIVNACTGDEEEDEEEDKDSIKSLE